MFHARILTGLPRVAFRENDSEQGIFFILHCSTQPDIQSYMTKEEKTTHIKAVVIEERKSLRWFQRSRFSREQYTNRDSLDKKYMNAYSKHECMNCKVYFLRNRD